MLPIRYTDISNKAAAITTLGFPAMSVTPPRANLDIFHIYIRNIHFLSTGSLFRLQNCPKSQAARSQSVRFLAF